jgi:hypothetical protein
MRRRCTDVEAARVAVVVRLPQADGCPSAVGWLQLSVAETRVEQLPRSLNGSGRGRDGSGYLQIITISSSNTARRILAYVSG